MSVPNSIVDFFQGNPFSNPVGSHIEKATDDKNDSENWTLNMETCDLINKIDYGPSLAIRAFKRRLTLDISKNKTIIIYTLTLLETCVKNCGHRFHIVVCSKDFLQELEKIVLSVTLSKQTKPDIPIIIRDRILLLIQTWFDSFRGKPDLFEIEHTYRYLRESGVEFPMTDLVAMSPINTPSRSVPPPKSPKKETINSRPVPTVVSNTLSQDKTLPTKSVDKLSRDLVVVQANIDVMSELMRENSPLDVVQDDVICLMKTLEMSCQEMQTRLVKLISQLDEFQLKEASVLFDLLRVNDEMNSVLIQYERYERTRIGQLNKKIPEENLNSRMAKSSLADIYAAQHEVTNFYDGLSSAKAPASRSDKQKSDIPIALEITEKKIHDDGKVGSLSTNGSSSRVPPSKSFPLDNDNEEVNMVQDRRTMYDLKRHKKTEDLFEL